MVKQLVAAACGPVCAMLAIVGVGIAIIEGASQDLIMTTALCAYAAWASFALVRAVDQLEDARESAAK